VISLDLETTALVEETLSLVRETSARHETLAGAGLARAGLIAITTVSLAFVRVVDNLCGSAKKRRGDHRPAKFVSQKGSARDDADRHRLHVHAVLLQPFYGGFHRQSCDPAVSPPEKLTAP
jgi:hypothetical protein